MKIEDLAQLPMPDKCMKILGLSKYLFYYDKNHELQCWGHRYSQNVKLHDYSQYHRTPYWQLVLDEGGTMNVTRGRALFLLDHPNVAAHLLRNRRLPFIVNEDGTYFLKEQKRLRRVDCFESFDDALATVLMMQAYASGDIAPIEVWLKGKRRDVIFHVAKLLKLSIATVERSYDEGEQLFFERFHTFSMKAIKPLMWQLCTCVKTAVKKNTNIRRLDLLSDHSMIMAAK